MCRMLERPVPCGGQVFYYNSEGKNSPNAHASFHKRRLKRGCRASVVKSISEQSIKMVQHKQV